MQTGQDHDESMLWHRFQAGDSDALGELMARHYTTLLRYGTRFTRDTDCIRDCMQDVFVELWNRRDTLRSLGAGQVKTYLMTVLRRLLHEQYLNQSRFSFLNVDDDALPLSASFSPEDQLISAEMNTTNADRIRQLVSRLPQRAKEAIHLRFFDNLDRQAVAQIMGISEQSVSNLLQEAFRLLRQQTSTEQFWMVLLPLFLA
ncbi:sigma-70 family RNA polymerase sigma factor [Fibrella sp. ES10-3-2-2]|nr:hypothetical protein A6C57_10030 [Fibrella sp. ES10-3-2-2]